ncbi:Ca2+-dependent phosphoinositide-specific phospholipase C [Sphingomonas sp. NFR15]|uniref:Ca2+-dependent phosphoinositide-specific phospholipase C n=1 Tax=Sphingomonas sp. NFR15 TaxID=1566282 RepID=UPI000888538B|nr:Ca2+-dependent phosphoinositide-specific phospholipase C [Sphingomonas sp. NFR15]SDA20099.1 Phosphoinositide phospholipase C, Ca2+-dependent [Sphingomonas sp. NFR15]
MIDVRKALLACAALAGIGGIASGQNASPPSGAANPDADRLSEAPLNGMRVLGSHNSYRPAFTAASLAEQRAVLREQSAGVEYGHPPIARQLDLGLRQLEFDPLADPHGGLYAAPYVGQPDRYAAMLRPGPKILHVPFVDRRTLCLTIAECLTQVARWSRAHPGHHPIVITINPSEGHTDNPIMPDLPAFDETALAAVDAAALAAFGPQGLVTPDQVRGRHASLRDAVTHDGWPSVRATAGKVLLVLDAGGTVLDRYRHGHASLRGRVMFGFYPEDAPEAAFLNIQDPRRDETAIRRAVAAGFIVRTRADAETVEARAHDRSRLEAASRSGAQIISTDYYAGADDPLKLNFVVRLAR